MGKGRGECLSDSSKGGVEIGDWTIVGFCVRIYLGDFKLYSTINWLMMSYVNST